MACITFIVLIKRSGWNIKKKSGLTRENIFSILNWKTFSTTNIRKTYELMKKRKSNENRQKL